MADEAQEEPRNSKQHAWQKLRGKFSGPDGPFASLPLRKHQQSPDDELEDFLRPSSASPPEQLPSLHRIDTASANPLWATRPEDLQEQRWRPSKPPRRRGLKVNFVASDAEVIGIGGDKAEEMTVSISQRKQQGSQNVSRMRSVSTSRPSENRIARKPVSKDGPEHSAPIRRVATAPIEGETRPSYQPESYQSSRPPAVFGYPQAVTPRVQLDQPQENTPFQRQKLNRRDALMDDPRNRTENLDPRRDRSESNSRSPIGRPRAPLPSPPDHLEGDTRESYATKQEMSRSGASSQSLLHPESRSPRGPALEHMNQKSPEPSPSRGLRRMRAEEGLAHRNSVAGLGDLPQGSEDSTSELGVSEVPHVDFRSRRRPAGHSRTPSQQSNCSPSPEPFAPSVSTSQADTRNHYTAPSSAAGYEKGHRGRRRADSAASNSAAPRPPSSKSMSPQNFEKRSPDRKPHLTDLSHLERLTDTSRLDQTSTTPVGRAPDHHHAADAQSSAALDEFVASTGATKAAFSLSTNDGSSSASLYDWTRCAIWWFLHGRSGIEQHARAISERQPSRTLDRRLDDPAILKQHHLNLSKSWWIINDVLPHLLTHGYGQERNQKVESEQVVQASIKGLDTAFRSLALSMKKRGMMPLPHDALVRGQTATLWLPQPFTFYPSDWMWVLSGKVFTASDQMPEADPLKCMPLGDTASSLCYGRIFARASIATGDSAPTHEAFDCVLTGLRDVSSPELKISIASQTTAVNVLVQGPDEHGVHWEHTRFDREGTALRVKLPQKLRLHISCHPRDFEWLSTRYEESREVVRCLRPSRDELLLGSFDLLSFQYRDSSGDDQFPSERQDICPAAVFESYSMSSNGRNHKVLRGYRIAVTTSGKSIYSVNVMLINNEAPFEFNAPAGDPSLRFQINQVNRRRSAHLTFKDFQQRDRFRDSVTGTIISDSEAVMSTLKIKSVAIAHLLEDSLASIPTQLSWRSVGVIDTRNQKMLEEDSSAPDVSGTLRMMMYDASGSYVDRFNAGSSEVRIRLEAEPFTSIQVMRPSPREDVTIAIGPDPSNELALRQAFENITSGPSVTSLSLVSHSDLHIFQQAVTGYKVLYDGIASTFSISRRRTGLPISKNWDAVNVRIQIVNHDRTYQLLAFFKDYMLADCLNIEVKRMDIFEKVDNKTSGHCVKMVDAKFVLPGSNTDDWLKEGAHRDASARYTSLAASEYAAEHEDILVAFPSEEDRDRFAEALPAPVTVGRKFTLKRRI